MVKMEITDKNLNINYEGDFLDVLGELACGFDRIIKGIATECEVSEEELRNILFLTILEVNKKSY